jgi:hypothetical protein
LFRDDFPAMFMSRLTWSRTVPGPVPSLRLSCAIYMHDPDGGGFAEFRAVVAPHATRVRRLHAHLFGDEVYDDSRDGVLPAQSSFAEPARGAGAA